MSKLAEALGELRVMAKRHEGEWKVYGLPRGLKLAWKVDGERHHLLMGRDGVMPSVTEEKVVLSNLPSRLVPVARKRDEEGWKVYWVLQKGGCPTCGQALDPEAMMALRTHCSRCPDFDGVRLCFGCGERVGPKGSWVDWCSACTTKRKEELYGTVL